MIVSTAATTAATTAAIIAASSRGSGDDVEKWLTISLWVHCVALVIVLCVTAYLVLIYI